MAQSPLSYVFRHLTASDGLASNRVSGILRDDRGFMWISTLNGLQRYDGYSFSTWHHNPADTNSLSTDGSFCLLKDDDGNLWLSSWPWGCTIFNPLSGKCRRIFDQNLIDVANACLDKDGNVWLISSQCLAEYERSSHRLILYRDLVPADIGFTRSILYDTRTDRLYINSGKYGICLFDRTEKKFYFRLYNPRHLALLDLDEAVGALYLDKENDLWISTYSGKLLRENLGSGKITQYFPEDPAHSNEPPSKLRIVSMLEDRRGTMWFASFSGLLHCARGDTLLQTIPENVMDINGLHLGGSINGLNEDPEGNIWVGTDNGINIFNPGKQKFISVPLVSYQAPGSRNYSVLNFQERENGDIWVASYDGGIFVFDKFLRFKQQFPVDKDHPEHSQRLADAAVWSLLQEPDGRLVVGAQHGWLSVYDPVTAKFRSYQPPGLRQLTISNMTSGKDHTVWMALYHGLGKWDMRTNSFTAFTRFMPYRGDTRSVVMDVIADGNNKLWVATIDHGLQEFDPSAGEFVAADTPANNHPDGISSSAVQSVIKIGDTLLGLGTTDAGINIYNKVTRKFSYITAADGLPSNYVIALYYHPPGYLWAATEQGLCRIDLTTRHVTVYGAEDGIARNDFSDLLRFYRLRNGCLLAGYKGGFAYFNPDSIISREPPRDVTITGMRVFEQPLSIDSILHGSDTAIFSHFQNFISIQYTSLSYTEQDRIKYYYQLEGVDQDWVSAGRRHVASYTDLPGGHYLFKVKCENNDHISCARVTSFYIIIVPPFWRTGWFYALVFAAVLALLYGIYRYRIGQILELQEMRNNISKDLHDDLGATLSSIAVLSEIARNAIQRGSPQLSFPMLEKISNYSRDMVDKMRDIVWAINPANDSLENIIKRLNAFSTESCSERGITFSLEVQKGFVNLPVPMNTRRNLYLICKEAIYNSIKHSGCNRISVCFDASAGYIAISIADDGKGFGEASHATGNGQTGQAAGNGLNNMRSRAAEIRASLEIAPGSPGTMVILRLAVPKNRD